MNRVGVLLVAATLCACGGGTAATPDLAPRPVRGSADRILEAEINAAVYQNALEVVRNLRPNMLVPRGTSTSTVPVVAYVDDVRMSDLNGLLTVPANRIREIRYVNARDATTRWGTGHGSGVILVLTKR